MNVIADCLWCGDSLVDGRDISGYTGEGPDYMTPEGDFGCDYSPDAGEDGCGSHTPDVLTTWDGHLIQVYRNGYFLNRHDHD